MAELIIRRGPDSGTRAKLDQELIIGRSTRSREDGSDFLRLSDAEISRRHVRIFREGDAFFVEDLQSTNGTLLHGKFLKPGQVHAISDGDELYFGNTQAVLRLAAQKPATTSKSEQVSAADFDLGGPASGSSRESLHVMSEEDRQPDVSMVVDASQILMQLRGKFGADHEPDRELVKRMQSIVQVSIALGAITDQDELLAKIAELIFDIFEGAERVFVVACDSQTSKFVPLIIRNREGAPPSVDEFELSRTIVNEVLEKRHALLLMDALGDKRFNVQESIVDLAIRSVMCAPMLYEDEVLGLIQVDTRQSSHVFSSEDLEILTGISAQIAVAMKNTQLYKNIEGLFEGFVTASVTAIESRDPGTAGHSFRVADYTEHLAKAVDRSTEKALRDTRFDRDQIQEIRYAALLHDFGKVGVREHVLTKAKKLYPHETNELKLRFKYAQACMERRAYLDLVNLAEANSMSTEEFRAHRKKIDAQVRLEVERLNEFLAIILAVNEPDHYYDKNTGRLHEINEIQFLDRDGRPIQLLSNFEFSVLSFAHGSLNTEERQEIESHVSHTYKFLSLIPWTKQFANIPDIAHAHHEKLDGTGYPRGLAADEIPVQSKIMTIADIFDALTAGDRPYREGITTEMALSVIEGEVKQGKLDEQLFRVFIESESYKHRNM